MKKLFGKIALVAVTAFSILSLSSCQFLLDLLLGGEAGEPEYATFDPENPKLGQTKFFYIDTNSEQSQFGLAKAVLRGKGEKCNVWVINGYHESDDKSNCRYYTYSDGLYTPGGFFSKYKPANSTMISDTFVKDVTEKFDDIYPIVTYLYGTESSEIYDFNTNNYVSMSKYDETNEKINIIIYDIGSDASYGGTMGYFWSKDYFTNSQTSKLPSSFVGSVVEVSNQGKYFYLDSYWGREAPGDIYSTLGHEFQHMIEYGVKVIDYNLDEASSAAHNEMKSMICEDFLLDYLGLKSDEGPHLRLPQFNGSYLYNGPEEYIDDYVQLSYASAYAFGAWLIRNFGGVDLVREMASNHYIDMESTIHAVNTVNGTEYTVEDLLRMYSFACLNDNDSLKFTSFNHSYSKSKLETGLSTTLKLAPIDLWHLDQHLYNQKKENGYGDVYDSIKDKYYYAYDGPLLYTSESYYAIRPYGMMLETVGKSKSSSASLTFNQGKGSTQSWTYNSSTPWVEVKPGTTTLSISGLPTGKNIYISKTNPKNALLDATDDRNVTGTTGITEAPQVSLRPLADNKSDIPEMNRAAMTKALGKNARGCYQPPVILPPGKDITRAAADKVPETPELHIYVVVN